MSEWVWGSSSSRGRDGRPLKKNEEKRVLKCPDCGNEVNVYVDGSVEKHKDFGKDAKGRPKKKGPWAWCRRKKWTQ